jgi:ribonuclease P protein component
LCPGSTRFPRRVRLTEAHDYGQVFKLGKYRLSNRWFTLLANTSPVGRPRLGLAISRKVARNAVARNRIKRVVRESFRHWQARLDTLDIVILGRAGVSTQPNHVLDAAMEKLWTQLIEKCAGSSSN